MIIRSAVILNSKATDLHGLMDLAEHESDAVTLTDDAGVILYVNPAFESLTGFSKMMAVGSLASLTNAGLTPKQKFAELWTRLEAGGVVRCEFLNRRCDGQVYLETKVIRPLLDASGTITNYVSQGWRSEGGQETVERLSRLALYDHLTGLPNRNHLLDRCRHDMALSQRMDQGIAICLIDLDRFKAINDRFGHAEGDRVLRDFAALARGALREVDFVARLGGDEFVISLWNISKRDDVILILERLLELLRRSSNQRYPVMSLSIGVALSSEVGMNISKLLNAADDAMYQIKAKGGAGFGFAERNVCRKVTHAGVPLIQSHRYPPYPFALRQSLGAEGATL